MVRPTTVMFDVNETLTDMKPLASRFEDLGAPASLAELWFVTLLRDGFALAAAGSSARFASLADGALRTVLAGIDLDHDVDTAVAHVLSGLPALELHPDVVDGVIRLQELGLRLVALTNGRADTTDQLLSKAGLRHHFEAVLSVEDAGVWKPAREAYLHAASRCLVEPAEMVMVAVHPWDVDGATRAGLAGAWLNRRHQSYPEYFTQPRWQVHDLRELADLLLA